jgi:hypothetical protein
MEKKCEVDYGAMTVVEALPSGYHYPQGGETILRGLSGAKIVRIGSPEEDGIEGGGFVIDYCPRASHEERRIVFAFNENGMWIIGEGPLPGAARACAMTA